MSNVCEERRFEINGAAERPEGQFVLYWMVATRRLQSNFALQYAVGRARALNRPLVVFEPLRCDYPWASVRHHAFIIGGMRDNGRALMGSPVGYFPYVEPSVGAAKGLLSALSESACLVVTDHQPGFFQNRMVASAGEKIAVRLVAVDSCGLMPVAVPPKAYPTAHSFRRYLQRRLRDELLQMPDPDPLRQVELPKFEGLPEAITRRWPEADARLLAGDPSVLAKLPIDTTVGAVDLPGGPEAGTRRLERFVAEGLHEYGDARNHPDDDGGSKLSPYLHFGHVGVHQVLSAVADTLEWDPSKVAPRDLRGAREGWWGMPTGAEAFMDELVTWRELGLNFVTHRSDYDRYESLPDWARRTLGEHAEDPRPRIYSLEELEAAQTDDEVWNCSQRELVREGRVHNYLRMLWGKKILEWSPSPRAALQRMIHLNNRWALDGRDANSYSGIFWVLGRYDRAWGPERSIFGKVRYMSSDNTKRKLRVKEYMARYR